MSNKRKKLGGIVERIFNTEVEPDDLAAALAIWAEMPEEEKEIPMRGTLR